MKNSLFKMNHPFKIYRVKLFFHKLTHWEYWPFEIVYIPVYFLWGYLAIRAKSLFFFNACNSTIKNGGFMNESKKEIYDLLPPQYYPKTRLIANKTTFKEVCLLMEKDAFSFPFIAKPDIGLRGLAVQKIENLAMLQEYVDKADFDYLLQKLIPYENELGVFYVRFPGEKLGKITGIVAKKFVIIEGDGIQTLEALVLKNPRFAFQLKSLQKIYGSKLQEIPELGVKTNLVPYGNHARGAKFLDKTSWATPELNHLLNEICLQIDGFYFGRMDLMYQSIADLEKGQHFSIVELNGAGSEPTHIYDPSHSLFFAWKELFRHINYMHQISIANHKNGLPYLTHKEGMKEYRLHLAQSRKIVYF
jgi:hypothetical protein